jgi:hypothetical protein
VADHSHGTLKQQVTNVSQEALNRLPECRGNRTDSKSIPTGET